MNKLQKINIFLILCLISLLIIPSLSTVVNAKNDKNLTKIMGNNSVSEAQMADYLFLHNDEEGNNPITYNYAKDFAKETIKEADKEGVRADVAFALMVHETGFLNFTGDVKPQQNNFGGLGATGAGEEGAVFLSMREGITAVVQHLKCYASTEPLNDDNLIDPRWDDSLRGKAEYVEYLGYADNPNKKGWAYPGKGYGEKVLTHLEKMKNLDTEKSGNEVAEKIKSLDKLKQAETSKNYPVIIFVIVIVVSVAVMLVYLANRPNRKRKK